MLTQHQMAARHSGKNRANSTGVFFSRINCGDCGGWYGSKVWHSNSKYRKTIWQCVAENARVALGQTKYQKKYDGLAERFNKAKARLEEVGSAITEWQAKREKIGRIVSSLGQMDGPLTEFNEDDWYSLVDYAMVYSRGHPVH